MRAKRFIVTATLALVAATLACNLPTAPRPLTTDEQAATAIEATLMEDRRNGADVPITATFSPIPNLIIEKTPTLAATKTITPTYSTPMLVVREQTNCRAGPGQDYEVIFTYLPNKKLEIVGRYGLENYWLVKSAESPTGQCWLWGEFVEVSGSYWAVSSVTPPPTATKAPPNAPSFQSWDYLCEFNGSGYDLTVTLKWSDKSNNETGFRLFRNGELVADLPANSTAYTDKYKLDSGQNVSYRLESYNPSGAESVTTSSFGCS
ncbi:MAG: SH3 domain-containing protein [Anaerolineales bacterium]|nr:MAG: SH3 domain-containing protein [Anaerolineales bacterium]